MNRAITIGCLLLAILASPISIKADSLNGSGKINYSFQDDLTVPLDPENFNEQISVPKEEYVNTTGALRFDYIPNLHFGAQEISSEDKIYDVYAQLFLDDRTARPNHVQITDHRYNMSGWELSVRQETSFYSDDDKKDELKGVMLSFDNQWANSDMDQQYKPTIVKDAIKIEQIGASYPIAKANPGTGSGTWGIVFGSTGNVDGIDKTLKPMLKSDGTPVTNPLYNNNAIYTNSAIKLFVPGKATKKPVKYKTVITWTLSELT